MNLMPAARLSMAARETRQRIIDPPISVAVGRRNRTKTNAAEGWIAMECVC